MVNLSVTGISISNLLKVLRNRTLKLVNVSIKPLFWCPNNWFDFLEQAIAQTETMPTDCKTLFVKGLPYSFKEDDIGDRFRRFGEIKSVRIAYNWQTKQSKGFAYVVYESHESAKNAMIKMNGKEVAGRFLKVDFDVKQSAKGSYHINTDNERNRLYNREPIKEAN